MRRTWLWVASVAAILGIIFAAVSLNNYVRIHEGGSVADKSFCSVSEFINCDVVEASSYASFKGIPVASFGLAYYLLILIFSTTALFSKNFKRSAVAFAWWTTFPAVAYSIALAYISFNLLKTLCLTCFGMYIANIALFLSLFLALNVPRPEIFKFIWGYWGSVITRRKIGIDFAPKFVSHLMLTVVVFSVGYLLISSTFGNVKRPGEVDASENVENFYKQSEYDIRVDKDKSAMWGKKNAPVTIVEFSDFRCPYCKMAAFGVKPFLVEYKKYISYYFINYPLDSSCNHYMQQQMHPGACLAAKGAICARRQHKFWKYHDEMFRSEERLTLQFVTDIAKKIGLVEEEFTWCINSSETERQLQDEIEMARKAYITATPTIFVNNRHLKYWSNKEVLREVIEREIARTEGIK